MPDLATIGPFTLHSFAPMLGLALLARRGGNPDEASRLVAAESRPWGTST